MLRYLGAADGADAIIRATEQTIADGTTTHDLGGSWWKREHEPDDGCAHRASEEVRSWV